jgi:hypothetical protein
MENTVRVAAEIFNELCDFLRGMGRYLSLLTWSTELFPKMIFELDKRGILNFFLKASRRLPYYFILDFFS